MDFITKLRYQQNILTCDNHVNYIWDKIHEDTDQSENEEDSEHFYNHIPPNFTEFLADCNHLLLNSSKSQVSLEETDIKYLVVLILTGLKNSDVPAESQSVPSQATVLFLSVAAMDDGNIFDKVTFNYLINHMLQFFKRRISYGYSISNFMFIGFNKFLQNTNQDIYQQLNQVLYFLRDSISDSLVTINNFNLDEDAHSISNKGIFICFKTIVQRKWPEEQKKEIVSRISILLIHLANNNTNIKETIKYFFKHILHEHLKHTWYIKLLIVLMEQTVKENDFFVRIINEIPTTDHYYSVVRCILNHFVTYPIKDVDMYLNILCGIIVIPHRNISGEIMETIVKKIIKQILLKSVDKQLKIKEKIMSVFIKLFHLKDIHVRRCLQQMFHAEESNRISTKVLFGIFESDVDVKWQQANYNTNFITLICEMFVRNKDFITAYRLKVIEILSSKATAFCLKPCAASMVEVIKRYAIENHPVVRSMLRILFDNALKPTSAANYYIKELFNLISDLLIAEVDCDEALAICNIILTDDFDFVSLLKAFETHNLITNRHLQVLFEEKSLKRKAVIWHLLSALFDLNYYVQFPPYIKYMILNCTSAEFYGKPESIYMVQVMSKIFTKEMQISLPNTELKTFAAGVQDVFEVHVKLHQVPIKHINDVLILLLTIQKITQSEMDWMKVLFYESLDAALENIFSEEKALLVQRNLAYAAKIFTLMDFKMEETCMTQLQNLIKCNNQQDMNVSDGMSWGLFITFYGRVCLKCPDIINSSIPYFQFAILYGTPYIQQTALFILYDICSIRLNYYDPFEPVIMDLIQSESVEVKSTAIKILISLINDDHFRISCSNFIQLVLVLVDRQLKFCLYFKDILEKEFFHRNEKIIAKFFIHLLFFLNNYKDHPIYSVSDNKLKVKEYTYERRSMVLKLLFGTLQRYNQFQILNLLNKEVIYSIYTGKMALTHNILNIFRDILNIILVTAMQYVSEDIVINEAFYEKLLSNIKKDFLTRSRHTKLAELEFNNVIENLMINLLEILHKIQRFNKDLLPKLFNVIAVATKAYYDRLLHILENSARLRDLYYELPKMYDSYKEIIIAEPVNILTWEKEEAQIYLEYIE